MMAERPQFEAGNFTGDLTGEFTVVPYGNGEVELIIDETDGGSTMLTLILETQDALDLIAALQRGIKWKPQPKETGLTQLQGDTLRYAVRNRGWLKVSSVKNHVVRKGGHPYMETEDVHALLMGLVHEGYLTEPVKDHQCFVWNITDKGREAVE